MIQSVAYAQTENTNDCPISVNLIPDKMNIMYEGLDNNFSYTLLNLNRDSFTLTSTQGEITTRRRFNILSNLEVGTVEIKLIKNNKTFTSFFFRVKEIPEPDFYISNTNSFALTKDALLSQEGLQGAIHDFDWNVVPYIIGYKVNIFRNGKEIHSFENVGANFTEGVRTNLNLLELGDVLQFKSISYNLIQNPNPDKLDIVKSGVGKEIIYMIQ